MKDIKDTEKYFIQKVVGHLVLKSLGKGRIKIFKGYVSLWRVITRGNLITILGKESEWCKGTRRSLILQIHNGTHTATRVYPARKQARWREFSSAKRNIREKHDKYYTRNGNCLFKRRLFA